MARPKPKEKAVQMGFRLPARKKALVEKRARREGVSVQKYIEDCLDLRLGLPDFMLEETRKATYEMQLPVTTVLANMIIKQFSFNQTWRKVFGKMPPGAMKEFRLEGGRLLTGADLLARLNAEHEKEITKLKKKLASAAMGNKNITMTPAEDELLTSGL